MDRWPSYIFDDRRNASENQVMSPSRVADVKRLDNATGWWQRGALGALPLSQGLMATDVPVAQQRCTQTCLSVWWQEPGAAWCPSLGFGEVGQGGRFPWVSRESPNVHICGECTLKTCSSAEETQEDLPPDTDTSYI